MLMKLDKYFNEYELRFLQVLLDKKTYGKIKHLQTVQGMKSKKVFFSHEGLSYEKWEKVWKIMIEQMITVLVIFFVGILLGYDIGKKDGERKIR